MSVFERLNQKKKKPHPIIAIYGTPGTGKTSLASEFPEPIYLYVDGEAPPDGIDLDGRMDEIKSFHGLLDTFTELLENEHPFQTVIIDSLDKVEPMVWEATCHRNGGEKAGWGSIDSNDKGAPTAFGKGFLAADIEWGWYSAAIADLSRAGMYVVQLLHTETKAVKDPLVDDYEKYRPKLQKRALEKITENCKALLFMNRRISIRQVDKGFGAKVSKPEGMSGVERVIHTDARAGFDAKNRLKDAPAQLVYKQGQGFADLSKYFDVANDNTPATQQQAA